MGNWKMGHEIGPLWQSCSFTNRATFKSQLWPKDFGNDQKNEIAEPLFGGWPKGTR